MYSTDLFFFNAQFNLRTYFVDKRILVRIKETINYVCSQCPCHVCVTQINGPGRPSNFAFVSARARFQEAMQQQSFGCVGVQSRPLRVEIKIHLKLAPVRVCGMANLWNVLNPKTYTDQTNRKTQVNAYHLYEVTSFGTKYDFKFPRNVGI